MKYNNLLFNVFFILLWFVFPILHFYIFFDSLAGPLFLALSFLFLFYFLAFKSLPILFFQFKLIVVLIIFLAHSFVIYFLRDINTARLISSFVLFCFVYYSSFLCYKLLVNYNDLKFHSFVNSIYYTFIIIFFLNEFLSLNLSYVHLKPIFPYNEPSHFCLFFSPFMYYKLVTSKGSNTLFFTFLSLIIAFISQNLIIVVSTLIIFSFLYRKKLFFLILVVAIGLFYLQKNEYFSSRLNISQDNDNISVLAYIQGWDFAYNHSINSNFFGIGFQQLGFTPIETDTSIKIDTLIEGKLNDKDGSFDASKIISEFGLFGIVILIFYFKLLIKSLKILSTDKIVCKNSSILVFCCCSVFSFFIEIFIRGVGYFSPTFFIFITSVLYIVNKKKNSKFCDVV
jgi:hypothetical protein